MGYNELTYFNVDGQISNTSGSYHENMNIYVHIYSNNVFIFGIKLNITQKIYTTKHNSSDRKWAGSVSHE